jgi:hypothetical protein
VILSTTLVVVLATAATCEIGAASARAGMLACAPTTDANAPVVPSAGDPCWSDTAPYPFGSDGNPAGPSEPLCGTATAIAGQACELQVTSMAFRAWNRGLAAAGYPTYPVPTTPPGNVAYGVWLYNGTSWYPDPTFPGSASCPGSVVLWAGKLDYWLIGHDSQTLCRFDGVDLVWEELPLPPPTLARLPIDSNTGKRDGGITAGACYAWNNCSFFGTDGIEVHWDGQVLSDTSSGLGASPWLGADFTDAFAATGPSGNEFGMAVSDSGANTELTQGGQPVPSAPDGSQPPQLFGSTGGAFTPLSFAPPTTPQTGDPFKTDLVAVASDPQGDAWVAGGPANRERVTGAQSAPLLRLTQTGAPAACAGYGASTFTYEYFGGYPADGAYLWTSLSVFPNDGSALAGGQYLANQDPEPLYHLDGRDSEPVLVRAACGQPPSVTRFVTPDPLFSNPATAPLIPADLGGSTAAVAANADNDAWTATTGGNVGLSQNGFVLPTPQQPHLYHWTDGRPPDAPPGNDRESRPSLFTLGPPVYVEVPPPVVVQPTTTTTTIRKSKPKKVKLKPAIYAIAPPRLSHAHGRLTLSITFKVRRPVRIGVEALRGNTVVASSGVKRFAGHSGQLSLLLDRKRWPTRLKFIEPKA